MSRFSRVLHHIDMNDVKRRHQEKIVAAKLEEERIQEEKEYIASVVEKEKSDWKKELEESQWVPVQSSRPVNSTSTTFQHVSGTQITLGGLGGVEVHPSTTVITGETVSTPTYADLALAGYAKPLGGIIKKINNKKARETNAQLDASEKATKMASGAAEIMKARVDPTTPGIMTQDFEKKMNEKLYEFQKKQSAVDQANTKIQLKHAEKISEYVRDLFKGKNKIDPIELYKKKAIKTETGAIAVEYEDSKTKIIVLTGKVTMVPSKLKPGEFGAYAHEGTDIQTKEFGDPWLKKVPQMPESLYRWATQTVNPKGALSRSLATAVAKKMGVSSAFNVLHYYIDNYVKQGGRYVPEIRDKSPNLTHLYTEKSKTWLRDSMNRLKKTIDFHIRTGDSDAAIQKLVDDNLVLGQPTDISNSIGNAMGFDVEHYKQTGNYQFNSTYLFTSTKDMETRGGSDKGFGIIKTAVKNWAVPKYVSAQLDGDTAEAVQNPMKFTVNISAGKPTAPSNNVPDSDVSDKRSGLSLDEPIVRKKKKVTKDT